MQHKLVALLFCKSASFVEQWILNKFFSPLVSFQCSGLLGVSHMVLFL